MYRRWIEESRENLHGDTIRYRWPTIIILFFKCRSTNIKWRSKNLVGNKKTIPVWNAQRDTWYDKKKMKDKTNKKHFKLYSKFFVG